MRVPPPPGFDKHHLIETGPNGSLVYFLPIEGAHLLLEKTELRKSRRLKPLTVQSFVAMGLCFDRFGQRFSIGSPYCDHRGLWDIKWLR